MRRVKVLYLLIIVIILMCITLHNLFNINFSYPNTPNLQAIQVMNGYPLRLDISKDRLYSVKIAIIDSGIDGKQNNLKINEIKSSHMIGNNTHGTTVASVIGAKENRDLKFNGLLPGITLYTYDIQSDNLNTDTLSKAIDEVSQIGVNVINISLSTYKNSPALKKSIENAVNRGITIVASVGNDSSREYSYPASYQIPGVISVGALDANFDVWSVSNFNDAVDIFVPGTSIYSINGNEIKTFNGTSMAAPLVTTWVAMLIAINPYLKPNDIERIIKETSQRHLVNWKQNRIYISTADVNKALQEAKNRME